MRREEGLPRAVQGHPPPRRRAPPAGPRRLLRLVRHREGAARQTVAFEDERVLPVAVSGDLLAAVRRKRMHRVDLAPGARPFRAVAHEVKGPPFPRSRPARPERDDRMGPHVDGEAGAHSGLQRTARPEFPPVLGRERERQFARRHLRHAAERRRLAADDVERARADDGVEVRHLRPPPPVLRQGRARHDEGWIEAHRQHVIRLDVPARVDERRREARHPVLRVLPLHRRLQRDRTEQPRRLERILRRIERLVVLRDHVDVREDLPRDAAPVEVAQTVRARVRHLHVEDVPLRAQHARRHGEHVGLHEARTEVLSVEAHPRRLAHVPEVERPARRAIHPIERAAVAHRAAERILQTVRVPRPRTRLRQGTRRGRAGSAADRREFPRAVEGRAACRQPGLRRHVLRPRARSEETGVPRLQPDGSRHRRDLPGERIEPPEVRTRQRHGQRRRVRVHRKPQRLAFVAEAHEPRAGRRKRRLAPRRLRQRPLPHDLPAVPREVREPPPRRLRHLAAGRHDDGPIPSRLLRQRGDHPVGHVVEAHARRREPPRRRADRLCAEPARRIVDAHHLGVARPFGPEVAHRPVDERVLPRLARLGECLHARDVAVQGRHDPPERVARVHLQRGVEAPPRPGRLRGRVAAAVVEDVVDAREEKLVQEPLDLPWTLAEVLADPGTAFRRDEARPLHVRRRGGELRNEDVAAVVEHLRLRDVGERVEVKPVRGCAVRLVAREDAACAAPVRPHAERLHGELGERFAVVEAQLPQLRRLTRPRKFPPPGREVVAAPGLERLEETRRPGRPEIFPRIVVERARLFVQDLECLQVIAHRLGRIRVEHEAAFLRGRALHEDASRLRTPLRIHAPGAVRERHAASAEAPAAPRRKVDAEPVPRRRALRRRPLCAPFRGEVAWFVRRVALHAVDRNHVEAAETALRECPGLCLQSRLRDGIPHPPVVDPRARLSRFGLPCRLRRRRAQRHAARQNCAQQRTSLQNRTQQHAPLLNRAQQHASLLDRAQQHAFHAIPRPQAHHGPRFLFLVHRTVIIQENGSSWQESAHLRPP